MTLATEQGKLFRRYKGLNLPLRHDAPKSKAVGHIKEWKSSLYFEELWSFLCNLDFSLQQMRARQIQVNFEEGEFHNIWIRKKSKE